MISLITGASGFIGQHLSARLKALGHRVLLLPRDWKEIPQCDYIFHLAAYGNKYGQTNEAEIIKTNIDLTWRLLKKSKHINYKAFINTASSSMYGTKSFYMSEKDSLDSDTFYGVTKASATLLCRAFAKKYGKPVVTTIPFSVYGPNDDSKHFIPTAIDCFKNDKEFNLAPGVHDWIYIDDYIEGILKVAQKADLLSGLMVNIGTGIQSTNFEIIAILRQLFQKPGKIKKADKMRSYDTNMWVADNSLLKELGWKQQVGLEEGLQRCIYGN